MSAIKRLTAGAQRYADALTAVLQEAGASGIAIRMGGVHPRVVYTYRGIECYHAFPGTPSDAVFGALKSVAELKRKLGLRAEVKRIGERRARHAACRAVQSAPAPDTMIGRPDWRTALYGHEIMRPQLPGLLDAAWLSLWRDCMHRAGAKSLIGGSA